MVAPQADVARQQLGAETPRVGGDAWAVGS